MARKTISDIAALLNITLEGNLIAPAMLAKAERLEAEGQSEQDYEVKPGLTIRDEIPRAFRIGQALFSKFSTTDAVNSAATIRFTLTLLKDVFGFADLQAGGRRSQEGRDYLVHLEAGDGRIPVIVVPPQDTIDRASEALAFDDRKRSASTALQDWLNAEDDALWGLATNGEVIRLMRDNASLTRPAFVEANLKQIFETEDYSSFSALWLLLHRSRFGHKPSPVTDCSLERWRDTGSKEGAVARDRLRDGVEDALKAFGSGFLEANSDLRKRLAEGDLKLTVFFNELLRIIYRLIFLMVAEDRNLLHNPDAKAAVRQLYAEGYSLKRLRERSVRRSNWDKHRDLYEGLKIIFRSLATGERKLGLPALGGLFDAGLMPDLDQAALPNRALMEAIYRLAWLKVNDALLPINWREMETEELGSVYESLLELTPRIDIEAKRFYFAQGAETKGNKRKTTGSYYTPDSLVQVLLDSALDPVLDRIETEAIDPAHALTKVTVIDPACGSGHFLLAAARRIATRVARIRAGGVASATDFRHALRDVARGCVYGVDRNPMAVELTKVALWIETVEPGKPLGFLDANIRCGDALLGVFDLSVLREGIPDAAYRPLTGDDKETAKHFKARNAAEKKGQGAFDFAGGSGNLPAAPPFGAFISDFKALPEDTVEEIAAKQEKFSALQSGPQFWSWRQAADLYIAAFLTPKTGGVPDNRNTVTIPTTTHIWQHLGGNNTLYGPLLAGAMDRSAEARAFHWPLEYPDIMQRGGFDVVVGNPPWDILKAEKGVDETLIHRLKEYFKEEPFNVLSGRRDLYKLFLLYFSKLVNDTGKAALITPVGYLLEKDSEAFRLQLWREGSLSRIYSFQNTRKVFFDSVHASYRFCITIFQKGPRKTHWFTPTITMSPFEANDNAGVRLTPSDLARYISEGAYGEIHDSIEHIQAHKSLRDLSTFNPDIRFGLVAEWHATSDKSYAVSSDTDHAVPVGKNRNIHHFNDQYAADDFFVSETSAMQKSLDKGLQLFGDGFRILIRDIARNDDTTTLISCMSKKKLSSYDTPAIQLRGKQPEEYNATLAKFLVGFLNSRIADFLIRPYVDKHIKGYVIERVPVPSFIGNIDLISQIADLVDQLIAISEKNLDNPIWISSKDAELLRQIELLFGQYLGVPRDLHNFIIEQFSFIEPFTVEGEYITEPPELSLSTVSVLADGVWAVEAPDERDRIRTQFRAMVGILDAPADARRVRLATLSCLYPQLLNGFLRPDDLAQWQRLIGPRAHTNAGVTTITPPTNAAWGAIYNELVSAAVLDVSSDGSQWGAGSVLKKATLRSDDPAIGRALFAWSRLQSVDLDAGLSNLSAAIIPFIREGRIAA